MKSLKLDHNLAKKIQSGEKTSTWRLFDDKDISVNDVVIAIDKVDANDGSTWIPIGEMIITKITQLRLGDITNEDMQGHERFASKEEMLSTYQKYYANQNVTFDTPVKIIRFTFKPYKNYPGSSSRDDQQIKTVDKNTSKIVKLFCDGGSRGNPGPSASGYAILNIEDELIEQKGIYLGVTTNNQAEYQALKLGLESALMLNAREVRVFMDSMLVVNQMKGVFKVKNRDLWPIHDRIKQLLPKFASVSFTHVPRELNKLADAEVNKVLDLQAAQQLEQAS